MVKKSPKELKNKKATPFMPAAESASKGSNKSAPPGNVKGKKAAASKKEAANKKPKGKKK